MSDENHKYPCGMSFWTTQEEYNATKTAAEENGLSIGAYLRIAHRQHLRAIGLIRQPAPRVNSGTAEMPHANR
jgi:hypothetical protein